MNVTINHAEFGDIVYEESFWTGKKTVSINGTPLEKISKKQFRLQDGGTVTVSGNFLQGACLNLNGETIRLTPKLKWYEVVLCILPLIFTLTWGNIPALCDIVPVVGGMIGGAIGGVFSMVGLYAIRSVKPLWLKIVIGIASFALTFGICCGIGYALISALN